MQAAFKVVWNGEEHDVKKVGAAIVVRFERHFGVSATVLQKDPSMEHMCYLAYEAMKKQDPRFRSMDFEQFLDGLEDIEAADVDDFAVDPTVPGQ